MCGIWGYDKSTTNTQFMAPALAIFMNDRGRASWGVTDGIRIHKKAQSIIDGFSEFGMSPSTYHTRAASVGSVCDANAHPFTSDCERTGVRVIGMHNGHINNHDDLDKMHGRNFAVDSQHIFAHIAERKDVGELHGWGAVVWHEARLDDLEHPKMYFSRFNTPDLHVIKLDTEEGEIVYASTKAALQAALQLAGLKAKLWYVIEERHKYSIHDGQVFRCGKMMWNAETVRGDGATGRTLDIVRSHGGASGQGPFVHGRGRSAVVGSLSCAADRCFTRVTKDQLVCEPCFAKIAHVYGITNDSDDDAKELGAYGFHGGYVC